MDCSLLDSSVHGISQARMLKWVAISFSRGFSRPGDRTPISCIAGRFFTSEPAWKLPCLHPSLLSWHGPSVISAREVRLWASRCGWEVCEWREGWAVCSPLWLPSCRPPLGSPGVCGSWCLALPSQSFTCLCSAEAASRTVGNCKAREQLKMGWRRLLEFLLVFFTTLCVFSFSKSLIYFLP